MIPSIVVFLITTSGSRVTKPPVAQLLTAHAYRRLKVIPVFPQRLETPSSAQPGNIYWFLSSRSVEGVMAMYDVVVVGAGIEGSATAYYLLKKGLHVLLLGQVDYLANPAIATLH